MIYSKHSYKTYRKIIEVFISICNTKGFYNTTLKEVCERADIYRSTFYRYFDNLDDIMRIVGDELFDKLSEYFKKGLRKDYANEDDTLDPLSFKDEYGGLLHIFFDNKEKLLLLLFSGIETTFSYKYKKWLMENIKNNINYNKTNEYSECFFKMLLGAEMYGLEYLLRNYDTVDDEMITEFTIFTIETLFNLPSKILNRD